MNIAEYIKTAVFLPRLKRSGVLVVYDPDRRYHEICRQMSGDELTVVDAGESGITSRETALETLGKIGRGKSKIEGMLVYVPAPPPRSDEAKQRDPFALYTVFDSVFPKGDGDEYLTLCLNAKPDHATEIRKIFNDNPNPDFAVIDAVGGAGGGWPTLRTLLNEESANGVLRALMFPTDDQKQALKDQEAWVSEAKSLFQTCLGMKLVSRGKSWSTIADELWRYVLFSEFVFDLPEALPASLESVPHSPEEARTLIENLCETARSDQRCQNQYVIRAESVENELSLPSRCEGIKDLGQKDTFPFEERTFLRRTTNALISGDMDAARTLLTRHGASVWMGKGEIQMQWHLARSALSLVEKCEDCERALPEHVASQDAILDYYLNYLREMDRLHREFEQAVHDDIESSEAMAEVVDHARGKHRKLAYAAQNVFTKHLEKSGWPPDGRLANADVFDKIVAPKLQTSGHRVAYVLIDALRYELGVELEKQLSEDYPVELRSAFAQFPTVTLVGMASLSPGAGRSLTLKNDDGAISPVIGSAALNSVNQRMDLLKSQYGDRFAQITLGNLNKKVNKKVELLVVRSAELDAQLETNPEMALQTIHHTMKRIRFAVRKLGEMGFHEVVVATDHGFCLNTHAEAGDVCAKPKGDWINVHERALLGDGAGDAANFAIPCDKAGIRGDFSTYAGPRSLTPYRSGVKYLHGGASLQEAIVPVISIRFQPETGETPSEPVVDISYKDGAKRITTRLPVFDVVLHSVDLFTQSEDFEILVEAHDASGNVVGEAKSGNLVNPATGTISLKPEEKVQVALKMQLEFEGAFTVKALNPTTFAVHNQIDLKTDYTV